MCGSKGLNERGSANRPERGLRWSENREVLARRFARNTSAGKRCMNWRASPHRPSASHPIRAAAAKVLVNIAGQGFSLRSNFIRRESMGAGVDLIRAGILRTMKLNLTIRKDGDITIVEFFGRFEIGESLETFRDNMRRQLEEGALKFIWDLTKLEYCDSSALGLLVSQNISVRSKGGDVKLVL